MRKRYRTGIVIGRFQPFHKGHAYLISEALRYCDVIFIGIGSSNKRNSRNNPLGFRARKNIIEEYLQSEKIVDRVKKIIPLPDIADDTLWFNYVIKEMPLISLVIGNNEWVNTIFSAHGIETKSIPFYKREQLEGQQIRREIREGRPWEEKVPSYLIKKISQMMNGK